MFWTRANCVETSGEMVAVATAMRAMNFMLMIGLEWTRGRETMKLVSIAGWFDLWMLVPRKQQTV